MSHLYHLRQSKIYQAIRQYKDVTRPVQRAIGQKRKPQPDGQPDFIRIDAVYKKDKGKVKGLYHINAVDEVTQFQAVCSVEQINETFLLPVLEELLVVCPFKPQGFH